MENKKEIHKTVRISKEMLNAIKKTANKEKATASEIIRRAIYYYVY